MFINFIVSLCLAVCLLNQTHSSKYVRTGVSGHIVPRAGLGKTTLAHIIARHCGYRPVEINASDDRTVTTLQARVIDAVQMQAVMGACRPNCVIIDEIDGAAGALNWQACSYESGTSNKLDLCSSRYPLM